MLELLASPNLPRSAAMIAVATWLTIAVINNMRDKGTNVLLLGTMFRMDLLKDEPILGQGLRDRRAKGEGLARSMTKWVIRAQVGICVLLWGAATLSVLDWLGLCDPIYAIAAINVAVGSFFALWTGFLCGGLYYGYWIKTPQVQQVHFTLFIISLLLWQMAS